MNIESLIQPHLQSITDAACGLSFRDLGFKTHVQQQGSSFHINLQAGLPLTYIEQRFKPLILETLKVIHPDKSVTLNFEALIRSHQTQLLGKGLRGVKNVIAIGSGKGGVGKSTVTVNLAAALTRLGAQVGILDADIYGPSIPMMLGATKSVEVHDDRYLPVRAHGIQAMSMGYLTEGEPALIWRGPMLAKSLIQMLDITAWDNLDYLLIDLPPGTGDIQLSLVQKIPLAGAIIVTTPQQIATADAEKAIKMFEKTHIPILGLIENMALHQCRQCGHQEALFGRDGAAHLAKQYQSPLLGQLPLNRQIGEDGERGQPTALNMTAPHLAETILQTALRSVLALSQRPLNYANQFPPIVVETA